MSKITTLAAALVVIALTITVAAYSGGAQAAAQEDVQVSVQDDSQEDAPCLDSLTAQDIATPEIVDGVAQIRLGVYPEGFRPLVFVVERGTDFVISFDYDAELTPPVNGEFILYFTQLRGVMDLTMNTRTPELHADGNLTIENLSGSLRAFVNVVDDISNFDAEAVLNTAQNYISMPGG
ncbi:MAG: hypothetical protein FWD98_09620 [Defluviitaleaceae bacterium]|nr:hypothetical protein [Defluviitaleaceae bacterium]